MKKKTFVIILALVLVFGIAVGGTIAYMTRQTDDVKNTFVAGEIGELDLTETSNTITGGKNEAGSSESAKTNTVENQYLVVPGVGIKKDPKVSFTHGGLTNPVAVYVFVKITGDWTNTNGTLTKEIASGKVLTATVNSAWTATNVAGVYYKAVSATETLAATDVLTSDANGVTITVPETITAEELKGFDFGSLNFEAYACQQEPFADANAAWAATFGAN